MLYEWIRGIAIYGIIYEFIINIIPNDSYKKYIKLPMGFIMIIVIISPILNLTSFDEAFNANMILENMKIDSNNSFEIDVKDTLYSKYSEQIEEQIKNTLNNEDIEIEKCNISINENGEIDGIEVFLKNNEDIISVGKIGKNKSEDNDTESFEEIKVIEIITAMYNLDKDKIKVY